MKKFIILSYKRSGSTMLYTLLQSHPDIRCHGELFLKEKEKKDTLFHLYRNNSLIAKFLFHSPLRSYIIGKYLKDIFQERDEEKAIGFKLMYGQARDFPYILYWIKRHRVKILHLHRRNILKTCLSVKLALQRGRGHSKKILPTKKITIDENMILGELTSIARRLKFMDWFCSLYFPHLSYIDIYYEDFLSDMEANCKKLLNFLGIKSDIFLKTELKKLNPNSVIDIVENYEKLVKALEGSYFEQFLY